MPSLPVDSLSPLESILYTKVKYYKLNKNTLSTALPPPVCVCVCVFPFTSSSQALKQHESEKIFFCVFVNQQSFI